MTLLSFAGSPHGGSHKLLPEWQSQPRISPVLILDHSIVGSAIGAWWYFHDSTGIEAHFIVRGRRSGSQDGHIWQLMDTDRQADANLNANDKAISIKTEDDGDPDTQPWTQAQLESLAWLHDKLASIYPRIRRREATDCDGPGLGYHSKLGAPSCWTPVAGKTCPGKPVRVAQWRRLLLPAFLAGEDLSMAFTAEDKESFGPSAIQSPATANSPNGSTRSGRFAGRSASFPTRRPRRRSLTRSSRPCRPGRSTPRSSGRLRSGGAGRIRRRGESLMAHADHQWSPRDPGGSTSDPEGR